MLKMKIKTLTGRLVNNELTQRALSSTPKFWKKVRNFFMTIGGGALTLWLANKELELGMDDASLSILRVILIVSIAVTGTAQLTKEDSNEVKS